MFVALVRDPHVRISFTKMATKYFARPYKSPCNDWDLDVWLAFPIALPHGLPEPNLHGVVVLPGLQRRIRPCRAAGVAGVAGDGHGDGHGQEVLHLQREFCGAGMEGTRDTGTLEEPITFSS